MKAVLSIVRYTFLQQFRNRLYLVVILFGVLMTAASLLFGALAVEQELQVIFDLGLALTELFGLIAAIFGAVVLILEEMESRTIYLILTRPIPRAYYVLGRYLGLLAAVVASMVVMEGAHVLLLVLKGWAWNPALLVAFPFMVFKIAIVTSLALFFSLFSTSAVASVVFTFFLWLLGHFSQEMSFLVEKSENVIVVSVVKAFLFVTPNFQILNYRDVWEVSGLSLGALGPALVYTLLYSLACVGLSLALFSRKEF